MANAKPFLVDGEPVSMSDLIESASFYDRDYAAEFIKTTSQAAAIMRRHGHDVTDNREP